MDFEFCIYWFMFWVEVIVRSFENGITETFDNNTLKTFPNLEKHSFQFVNKIVSFARYEGQIFDSKLSTDKHFFQIQLLCNHSFTSN